MIKTMMQDSVLELTEKHADTWRDMDQMYWLARLGEEFGELSAAIVGDHEHSPDWELQQIAAICLNWLDMRNAPLGRSVVPHKSEAINRTDLKGD